MSSYASIVETLKPRFDFEAWAGQNTLRENLYIWKFFLTGDELTGWKPHRIQPVKIPGFPPAVQSIWCRSSERPAAPAARLDPTPETVLQLDTYECGSRMAAHEFIVYLLGQFHLPGVERILDEPLGDVAFSAPGNPVILFARANLVHMMRNVGRLTTAKRAAVGSAVTEDRPLLKVIAGELDVAMIQKPEPVAGPTVDAFESVSAPRLRIRLALSRRARVGETVPLMVEYPVVVPDVHAARGIVTAEQPTRIWYKIFSDGGEVLLSASDPSESTTYDDVRKASERADGQLMYRPDIPGRQSIFVFAIDPELRRATLQELPVEAY